MFKYQISLKSVKGEPSCSALTDGQTWQSQQSPFEILRERLKFVLQKVPLSISTLELPTLILRSILYLQ